MFKNILIVTLIVVASYEGLLLVDMKSSGSNVKGVSVSNVTPSPTPTRMPLLTKGMKFVGTPYEKNAYLIAPGDLSIAAQKALVGWNIKKDTLADGSLRVSLIPKDSDDIAQTYTIKPGYSLYFVEITFSDDTSSDKDLNLRDDYGIIVDKDGIVQ